MLGPCSCVAYETNRIGMCKKSLWNQGTQHRCFAHKQARSASFRGATDGGTLRTLSARALAIRQGWFAEAFAPDSIAVLSLAASTDRTVHLSHYRHTQPDSLRFGGFVPPLVTRSRGTDVRVVGPAWTDRAAEISKATEKAPKTVDLEAPTSPQMAPAKIAGS